MNPRGSSDRPGNSVEPLQPQPHASADTVIWYDDFDGPQKAYSEILVWLTPAALAAGEPDVPYGIGDWPDSLGSAERYDRKKKQGQKNDEPPENNPPRVDGCIGCVDDNCGSRPVESWIAHAEGRRTGGGNLERSSQHSRIVVLGIKRLLGYGWLARTTAGRPDWRRVVITPPQPVVLLGYGDRTKPFEAVEADIHAKALALEDGDGRRAVIVTADLVGFQAAVITDYVCEQIQKRAGLQRSQLLFNASHTHTGPLVSLAPHTRANPVAHAPLTADDVGRTIAYTHELREKLVQLVCDALARLEPARLSWGRGSVDFPMNRRLPMSGQIVMSDNPSGSTDRTVPILRVESLDGTLRGVLFACACHNTALTGKDNVIAGDYAGFAQAYVEARHPGAQAMFMSGCGGDANPSPRGSLEIARQHGATLGTEVCRLLDTSLEKIDGGLRTAYRLVELPLQKLTRVELEAARRTAVGRSRHGSPHAGTAG